MNDEHLQSLLAHSVEGTPGLTDVTEAMRAACAVTEPRPYEEYLQSAGDPSFSTQVVQNSSHLILDSMMGTEGPDLNNDCQSGPSDLAWERRERDRSGTKPKKRKWQARQKAKAARKARRNNR